jgi:GTPase SAR1 family protein
LVFSIIDDSTFEGLKKIRDEILGVHPDPKVPMLLVGNKKDLESERAVTEDEAKALAAEFGKTGATVEYIEVSAFKDDGIDTLFNKIVNTIFIKNPHAGQSSSADSKGVLGAGAAAPATAKAEEKKKKGGCMIL